MFCKGYGLNFWSMSQIKPTYNLLGSHHLVSLLSWWWCSISVQEIIALFIIHWSECNFFHLQYLQIEDNYVDWRRDVILAVS